MFSLEGPPSDDPYNCKILHIRGFFLFSMSLRWEHIGASTTLPFPPDSPTEAFFIFQALSDQLLLDVFRPFPLFSFFHVGSD